MEDCVVGGVNDDVVDIGNLVNHFNYIRDKLWPLGSLARWISKIRRFLFI